ncbi:hypothetical protein O0V09_17450, partial [Dasania sp. GY-19]
PKTFLAVMGQAHDPCTAGAEGGEPKALRSNCIPKTLLAVAGQTQHRLQPRVGQFYSIDWKVVEALPCVAKTLHGPC